MAFFEQRLSPRISYGARGGPVFSTTQTRTRSGRRAANRNWSRALHRYDVTHAIRDESDFDELRAMFYVVAGAYDGFRFKDWADYRATRENTFATFISGTQWQLQRRYAIGSRTYLRDIKKPCASPAIVIWRWNGAAWSVVAGATVDTTTGVATIPGHVLGNTYAWVGEFDVPVNFADDAMSAAIVDKGAGGEFLLQWEGCVLEELRL